MTVKVAVYEENGVEYDTPTERELTSLLYSEGLSYYSITQTNSMEVGNTTWTSLGLTLSPPAGTYLAFFSGSLFVEGGGAAATQSRIVVGGSPVAGSVRETRNTVVMVLGLIGGNSINAAASNIIMPITVGAGQSVDVQCAMGNAGTDTTITNRTLTLLRLK